jgi:hypothetical protein
VEILVVHMSDLWIYARYAALMCQTASRVYVVGIDPAEKVAYWGRPDCHLWRCSDCAEVNKRRWTAIVANGIQTYQEQGVKEWRFVTLTARGDRRGYQISLHDFRQRWPKLHERMKRAWGKQPYVLLPEQHLDGTYHMHGLFGGLMTTRWLKDNSASCGFGFKAEAEAVLSLSQVINYSLKYITKSLTNGSNWPKSLHRVRTSQKWPKQPLEGQISLPVVLKPVKPERFEETLNGWIAAGWNIVNFQTNGAGADTSLIVDTGTGELVTNWNALG